MTSLMWWRETGRTSSCPPYSSHYHYHLEVIIHMVLILLSRVYIPCIYVLNKIDQISIEELDVIYKIPHCVPISAHHRWNFDDLLEKLWDYLHLVRMWVIRSCNAFWDGMLRIWSVILYLYAAWLSCILSGRAFRNVIKKRDLLYSMYTEIWVKMSPVWSSQKCNVP